MSGMIQYPLFPLGKAELDKTDAYTAVKSEGGNIVSWYVRNTSTHGPVVLHYLPFIGAWAVSTHARIVGPSGRRAVKMAYLYPKLFPLNQQRGAMNFARRASEPWLEQSVDMVLSSILSRTPIQPYDGYPYG